jgi:hypothetical protein
MVSGMTFLSIRGCSLVPTDDPISFVLCLAFSESVIERLKKEILSEFGSVPKHVDHSSFAMWRGLQSVLMFRTREECAGVRAVCENHPQTSNY